MASPARLPHFIIGGAPRSGTTFLCHVLDRHPHIYMAKPYLPEPKVFHQSPTDHAGYCARYAALFAPAEDGRLLGEKTSNYLESADACALIREHLSHVRMLFLVREPVARAYSNYLWSKKNGLETLCFEEAIRLEGSRPSPLSPERPYARPFDYLSRGRYDVFAQRYYEALGRDAVRFFVYEGLAADPERVLPEIQRFIGVEPLPLDAATVGVVLSAKEMGPPLDPAMEFALKRRMKPSVERFQALTGLDVSAWGYDRLPQ
jgi:hypothetical protein